MFMCFRPYTNAAQHLAPAAHWLAPLVPAAAPPKALLLHDLASVGEGLEDGVVHCNQVCQRPPLVVLSLVEQPLHHVVAAARGGVWRVVVGEGEGEGG